MTTVRFSLVTFAAKSLVAEEWVRTMYGLLMNRSAVKASRISRMYETRWESELKRLQAEVHTTCQQAIHQLIPLVGVYEQKLLDRSLSAYAVYAPQEAESVFSESNRAIEALTNHISEIRANADQMLKANRRVDELPDMHAKAILYHNSVKPYMETLCFHMDQLKAILRLA